MSRRVDALILVMIMAIAPLVPMASAHPSIGLSTDVNHVILSPGEATNITLTINNNGSTIETYSIAVSGFDSVWEVIPSDSNVSGVIPTFSATTNIAVRLSTTALPNDSGTLTITVTEPDANVSSTIDVQLSVLPQYLPAIDASSAGDNGLVEMAPGDEVNLSIMVANNGNVNDTILLSVDQTPDLVAFWSNWTTGGFKQHRWQQYRRQQHRWQQYRRQQHRRQQYRWQQHRWQQTGGNKRWQQHRRQQHRWQQHRWQQYRWQQYRWQQHRWQQYRKFF